ncbi:YgeY family selenium metabolism-linked hydrolase [Escherichia coli]
MSVFSLKIDIADNKFFNGETSSLFSQSQAKLARQFHQKIAGYRPTPLCALDDLANLFGVKKILVKDESKRFGLNAFKMLGGAYAIAQLLCEKYHLDIETLSFEHLKNAIGEKMTFATTTDGNHGRGVAWAAQQLGQNAVIYMPKGSAQERGDNAIFKMGPILGELQELSQRLGYDEFLGKGTLTVSEIFFTSPSRCAVADSCAVSIDRRLTWGETWEGALDEIRALPAVQKANAVVSMYNYDRPSWTGLVYPTECYFPTWKVEEDHFTVKALVNAYEGLFGKAPVVDKWTFSTNGVSIMGRHGIPVIGFGPGKEPEAHAPNEKTWKSHLVTCAAMYAAIPLSWLATE